MVVMGFDLLSSRKGAILGVFLAVIISTSCLQLATLRHNVIDDSTTVDWNFSSGLTLSNQISDNANKILAVHFQA